MLFPNENHWVLTPQNSISWYCEVEQWLSRYLGGKPMEKPVFSTGEEKELPPGRPDQEIRFQTRSQASLRWASPVIRPCASRRST